MDDSMPDDESVSLVVLRVVLYGPVSWTQMNAFKFRTRLLRALTKIINRIVWVLDADWLKQHFAGITKKVLFTVLITLVTSL
jgi:hypothetical protein